MIDLLLRVSLSLIFFSEQSCSEMWVENAHRWSMVGIHGVRVLFAWIDFCFLLCVCISFLFS